MHVIWAIAKNTIKLALRMKIAIVIIILLLVLLPMMGSVMTGDVTIKGRLQTFISYSLSLISLLLCSVFVYFCQSSNIHIPQSSQSLLFLISIYDS